MFSICSDKDTNLSQLFTLYIHFFAIKDIAKLNLHKGMNPAIIKKLFFILYCVRLALPL